MRSHNATKKSLRRKTWILEQQRNLHYHLYLECIQRQMCVHSPFNEMCEISKKQILTVLFVSFRDTIFSFVGRRLYFFCFQLPASSIVRARDGFKNLELPRKSRKLTIEVRKRKNHIHFHRARHYRYLRNFPGRNFKISKKLVF